MAAEPDILINNFAIVTVTSIQSQNGVTVQAASCDLKRQRATSSSAENHDGGQDPEVIRL